MPHAELVQARGPISSPISIRILALNPAIALGEHRRQRRDVDAVLAFVVGGAAAVDAGLRRSASRATAPAATGRRGRAPRMAVDQHGDQVRVLDALRHQERRTLAQWIVEDARGEAERGERGRDLVVEIAAQHAGALRLLAGARDGDAPRQIGDERAAVEIGVRARSRRSGSCCRPFRGLSPFEWPITVQGYCLRAAVAARMLGRARVFKILHLDECPASPMEPGRGEQIKLINPGLGTEKVDVHLNRLVRAARAARCITTPTPTTSTS